MQTRDQEYAVDAYKRVSKIKEADRTSYGSMAHKLPILIRRAGLAQALSFVESRGSEAQKQLLEDLGATVRRGGNLANAARSAELADYMLLTKQVMDALLWYKRFAQSVLGVDVSDATREEVDTNEQSA